MTDLKYPRYQRAFGARAAQGLRKGCARAFLLGRQELPRKQATPCIYSKHGGRKAAQAARKHGASIFASARFWRKGCASSAKAVRKLPSKHDWKTMAGGRWRKQRASARARKKKMLAETLVRVRLRKLRASMAHRKDWRA